MLDPVGTSVDVAQAPALAPESEPAYRRRALLQDDYVEEPIADLIHSTADAPAAAPKPAYRRRALRQVDDIPTAMPIDEPTIPMMPVDEPARVRRRRTRPRPSAIRRGRRTTAPSTAPSMAPATAPATAPEPSYRRRSVLQMDYADDADVAAAPASAPGPAA